MVIVSEWFERGGVLILGYDSFRIMTSKNQNSSVHQDFQKWLTKPGPDLVICDEGHLLKNDKTSLNNALRSIRSTRRIILTGTPLQNKLEEYYCMVNIVKPNLLGTEKEFGNRFINPITNGQFQNSSEADIQLMKERSYVLNKLLEGCVHRLDTSVLQSMLPPKYEYVLFIRLSSLQVELYKVLEVETITINIHQSNGTCFSNLSSTCHTSRL